MSELSPSPDDGGIYVHVPFCLRKCPYCDFYSATDRSLVPHFLDALQIEMRLTASRSFRFDTLYLGGGTPSLLDPAQVARIVSAAGRCYPLMDAPEITLEVNPGTVTLDRIKGYRDAGVNRLNIGVQSFSDRNLAFLGRIHTAEDARQTLKWARKAGFDNIGMDLIYGLPGQKRAAWMADLKLAVAFQPEHLACYTLTYETGTPLDRLRRQGRVRPLPDARVGDLFQVTGDFLVDSGYAHYEISNFSVSAEYRSRHNRKYWNFSPYIGLGPSAHSYHPPTRRWNRADVGRYIRDLKAGKPAVEGQETLTRRQEMIEAVYLGLRRSEGISIAGFAKRFKASFGHVFGGAPAELAADGLIHVTPERCALSPRGMLFLDSVAGRLVSELE